MTWDVITAWIEVNKTIVASLTSLLSTIVTLAGGWVVGLALAAKWNMRVKERELDFDAIRRVRDLYGEFLSTRRLWNHHKRKNKGLAQLDDRGLVLFDRSCLAEGQMEALLIKIASERKLTQSQLNDLGLFRQGYQQLRQSIRDCKPLEWGRSDHPEYVALKSGCQAIIGIIIHSERITFSAGQFEYITSNVHEKRWRDLRHAA
jgi:hypothetical protein